jgi:FkbM family methyltransferase
MQEDRQRQEVRRQEAPRIPPMTLEEKFVNTLVPAAVLWRYRAWKAWSRGESELRLLRYLADPAKTSVDAGANKGVYTYFLSGLCRHVYAYEPNPKIFGLLQRSVHRPNVTLRATALSDVTGEDRLIVPKRKAGYSNQLASLRKNKFPGDAIEVPVETRRLDDEDVGQVGFIKIDVEGFERQVLMGGLETLKRHRPRLLIEIEEAHTEEPIETTLAFVCSLGYEGLFMLGGRLMTLARFDPVRHHRQATAGTFVYNFVFLPA